MIDYLDIEPSALPPMELQGLLQGAIAPRPICFASSIDKEGKPNLSPFSFFNLFSTNPPILIFSPARRVRDNTIKHTLENVMEVDEVCINVVNYEMVWQTSLASTEYEKGVDEFIKSGLTKIPSEKIKPFRVAESPVQLECKVNQVLPLGEGPGAGNLVICEVLFMHINKNVLTPDGKKINPNAIDLVARLGGDWYCRAKGDALFDIEKPVKNKGIGVDQLPEDIRNSYILSGNDIGQLANVEQIPDHNEVIRFKSDIETLTNDQKHILAKALLAERKVNEAWLTLLS